MVTKMRNNLIKNFTAEKCPECGRPMKKVGNKLRCVNPHCPVIIIKKTRR
jgi:hypothetical protein